MPDDLFADLEAAGVPFRVVETGDPGVIHDVSTARADLPPYDGPPEPAEHARVGRGGRRRARRRARAGTRPPLRGRRRD